MRDLREWIDAVDKMGELQRINGADSYMEIGSIVELYQRRMGFPALLFDNIKGYSKGYRVLANSSTSVKRIAYSFGLSPESREKDLIMKWRKYLKGYELIPPKYVKKAPVLENVLTGKNINLHKFPAPFWHELDGGRYIATGSCVILKDPDSDWVNFGCYRSQVFDKKNITSVQISEGKQGFIIMNKYKAKGEVCPIAISCGQDPLLFMVSGMEIPYGMSEYDVVGGLAGEPVEVVKGPMTGLPIPAKAEIVIEGEIAPDELIDEGPFGEWGGYYGPMRPKPLIKIKSILHRNDPIILGAMPRRPPCDDTYYRTFLRCAAVWDELEKAGVPGIQGVWAPEAGGGRFMLVISIKQMYPGHAKQAGLIASQCHAGAYVNRIVVVVDDDVDPYNMNDVIWALCTRTDPKDDVEILKRCWSSAADPMGYPVGAEVFNSRMVIDSCIPWERRSDFPKCVGLSAAEKERTIKKWKGKLPHLVD